MGGGTKNLNHYEGLPKQEANKSFLKTKDCVEVGKRRHSSFY